MSYVEEVLRTEEDGSCSFGNHSLAEKKKVEDFKAGNDILKVKTFKEITKLEKNDLFVYESVPGTSVFHFAENDNGVTFEVCGDEDAQITIGLKEDTEYEVSVNNTSVGTMKTNLSGKLSLSVELSGMDAVPVSISKK